MENLQLILGVDKHNPLFSLYSSTETPEQIEVYFGLALIEKVEKGKNSIQFKILLGRLYNAGYKCKELTSAFDVDLKTIRKWGNALKSNDYSLMESAFAGHEAKRKLTGAIESYVRIRFREIYRINQYNYSAVIRNEIAGYFQVDLSGETLRTIFNQEKTQMDITAADLTRSPEKAETNKVSSAAVPYSIATVTSTLQGFDNVPGEFIKKELFREHICDYSTHFSSECCNNRKQIPSFARPVKNSAEPFVHHAGILIVLQLILSIIDELPLRNITCQWMMSVLLGAVNIEQSRKLDFEALNRLAGLDCITSTRHQRSALKSGSTEANRLLLFKRNARFTNIEKSRWLYYDPHGIRYNGMRKILKGWCGSIGKTTRVHYQDFIHTQAGKPVFIKYFDNYYDLRERFFFTVPEFRKIFAAAPGQLVFVIDRGIYGRNTLSRIHASGDVVITWEKGYKHDGWSEELPIIHFRLTRYRNNYHDTVSCQFDCVRYPFEKIPGYDRIIVRASAEKKEDIEVSVLVNSSKMSTRDTVTAIFTRWLQENDFLYENRHLGINQITSYDYENYAELSEGLIDKIVESNEFIALKLRQKKLEEQIKSLLLRQNKRHIEGKKLSKKTQQKLNELNRDLANLKQELAELDRYCTKREKLIELGAQKLMTAPKQYMDIVKICVRNVYFSAFEEFREQFNNFRIDHVVFRTLIQSPGRIETDNGKTTISLYPAITLQPKEKVLVNKYLEKVSETVSERFDYYIDFALFGVGNNTK